MLYNLKNVTKHVHGQDTSNLWQYVYSTDICLYICRDNAKLYFQFSNPEISFLQTKLNNVRTYQQC